MKEDNKNKEFKEILELYNESKRFLEFTKKNSNILNDPAFSEEIASRKKIIFNFECGLVLLDEFLYEILHRDIAESNTMWYVGYLSRSTYYRNRKKAIENFLINYHHFENL